MTNGFNKESRSSKDFPYGDREWIHQGLPCHRGQPTIHASVIGPLTVTMGGNPDMISIRSTNHTMSLSCF